MKHFLNILVAQREAVVQPDGVLDDGHRESVAVRGRVGHSGSAYPSPVKAKQPVDHRDGLKFRPSLLRLDATKASCWFRLRVVTGRVVRAGW